MPWYRYELPCTPATCFASAARTSLLSTAPHGRCTSRQCNLHDFVRLRHVVLAEPACCHLYRRHTKVGMLSCCTYSYCFAGGLQSLLCCFAMACRTPPSLPHFQSKPINDDGCSRPSGLITMHARMKEYGVGSAPRKMSS